MKKEITLEEYNHALERLEFIQSEQDLLKQIKETPNFQPHIKFPNSFIELIINLKKENDNLDSQINLLKKRFLHSFSDNKKIYEKVESKLEQLIFILNNEDLNNSINTLDTELLPILNNYPTFDKLFQELKELTSKKIANNHLFNYINSLQEERDHMITVKAIYEKQQRKRSKQKKLIKKRIKSAKTSK